jgi:predicted DNA-binding transcriptional regulator AlpA
MMPTKEKPLLTAKDLAELLGVSLRSVWRRKNDGTLPKPIQIGRMVRWHRQTIETWLLGN